MQLLENNEVREETIWDFINVAALLKHQGFQEEREIRIIAIPMSEQIYEGISALSNKLGFRPLKETAGFPPLKKVHTNNQGNRLYLNLFESLEEPLPITRIIVGPSRHQKEDEAFVRDLTKGTVPIMLSETPYIGP